MATDGSFSTYYVFNEIIFHYLKTFHQSTHESEMKQTLMLLTSDTPSYDLSSLKTKY